MSDFEDFDFDDFSFDDEPKQEENPIQLQQVEPQQHQVTQQREGSSRPVNQQQRQVNQQQRQVNQQQRQVNQQQRQVNQQQRQVNQQQIQVNQQQIQVNQQQRPVNQQQRPVNQQQIPQQVSAEVETNNRMRMQPRQNRGANLQHQSNRQVQQPTFQQMSDSSIPLDDTTNPPRKKFKLSLILVLLLLLVIGLVVYVCLLKGKEPKEQAVVSEYTQTGRFAYDNLLSALKTYDAVKIDDLVGSINGDSYLAQEWSYANNIDIRQRFITSVCAYVNFTYPQVPQLSSKGNQMTNKDGTPILINSDMNNGEYVTVTHVDYNALSATMREDKQVIEELYKNSGYSIKDYDYEEEMVNLMLDYIVSKANLPTKTTDIQLQVLVGANPIIVNDLELDKLLFSSDDFHIMCDVFSQVATGFTGKKYESYTVKEEQSNPEYKKWEIKFNAYYEADGGKFTKGKSKWEPWYLYDENHNLILDENGNRIVEYYTVKDDNGNDWVQPPKTILVDVEKQREIDVEWVNESVVPYCFLGAYYCQNEYKGNYPSDVKVGDGSIEYPAGVGTPIITKCLGTDGKYHDVKVTLIGYWKGQDAIDYAITFSEKNRGFDINSVIQLICYEIKIENLEPKAFTFESDMFLADKNANKSTRTGTMYGFHEKAVVEPNGTIVVNDWATSTELEQKYVCWGESFGRSYSNVYFKILAGQGNVPTYSAYKAFTGSSQVSE